MILSGSGRRLPGVEIRHLVPADGFRGRKSLEGFSKPILRRGLVENYRDYSVRFPDWNRQSRKVKENLRTQEKNSLEFKAENPNPSRYQYSRALRFQGLMVDCQGSIP